MVCIDITQEELNKIIESLEYKLLHTDDNYDRIEILILLMKLEK